MMKAFVCHASCTASHQFRAGGGCSSNCYCYSRPKKPRWSLLIDCEAVIGCYGAPWWWSRERLLLLALVRNCRWPWLALPLVLCFALLLPCQPTLVPSCHGRAAYHCSLCLEADVAATDGKARNASKLLSQCKCLLAQRMTNTVIVLF